ncbi:MAG: polysaccharide biosynthesis protein [Candidatus Sulfotelmatobacter sp.]
MMHNTQDGKSIWTEFAGNSCCVPSSPSLKEYISGKTLLITGAGGSIGSALARFATTCYPDALILLDSNEHSLHALEQSFDISRKVAHIPILGSICDSILLSELFALYRPQIILHAAACKHVPLMELNPLAAASTNVLGTYAVLQAASEFGAAQFIMVSTDKAVLPASIMGATKRLAELLLFAHPDKALQRKAVRLGNVLASSGSVGPIFLKQIMEGGPVTVTHPNARRFFLTLDHAVTLLMTALSPEYEAGILIPDLGPSRTVEELARYLIAATAREQQGIEIIFTGLRPGDKVEELLSSSYESVLAQDNDLFSTVQPERMAVRTLHGIMEQITLSVRQRDLRLLLESICKAVPEYRPGHVLQQLIENKRQIELRK